MESSTVNSADQLRPSLTSSEENLSPAMKTAISYLLVLLALAMPMVLCYPQPVDAADPDDGAVVTYQSGELHRTTLTQYIDTEFY